MPAIKQLISQSSMGLPALFYLFDLLFLGVGVYK